MSKLVDRDRRNRKWTEISRNYFMILMIYIIMINCLNVNFLNDVLTGCCAVAVVSHVQSGQGLICSAV